MRIRNERIVRRQYCRGKRDTALLREKEIPCPRHGAREQRSQTMKIIYVPMEFMVGKREHITLLQLKFIFDSDKKWGGGGKRYETQTGITMQKH
jgi:hypothetical protein